MMGYLEIKKLKEWIWCKNENTLKKIDTGFSMTAT